MKKSIFTILMFSVLLFSCEKEEIKPNESNDSFTSKSGKTKTNPFNDPNNPIGNITDPNNDEDENKKVRVN